MIDTNDITLRLLEEAISEYESYVLCYSLLSDAVHDVERNGFGKGYSIINKAKNIAEKSEKASLSYMDVRFAYGRLYDTVAVRLNMAEAGRQFAESAREMESSRLARRASEALESYLRAERQLEGSRTKAA